MQFWKDTEKELKGITSIVLHRSGKYYCITDGETSLGRGFCTPEQRMQIDAGDYSSLHAIYKELGVTEDEVVPWVAGENQFENKENIVCRFGIEKYESKPRNELPYGVFTMSRDNNGNPIIIPHFKEESKKINIIQNKNLKGVVKDFFENPIEGRKHKMGLLLYGPPGNGKTTEILELIDHAEELKLRVFLVDSETNLYTIELCRKALNGERNVFVFEEMTERLRGLGGLESLLTFLDGEKSWNNTINIATTNYPEDFPANLVDRPGRFEKFIEYGNPTEEDIIRLGEKFGISKEDSVTLSGQRLSFDYVSYIMGLSKKLGTDLKTTKNNEEEKRKRLSSTFKGKMGL